MSTDPLPADRARALMLWAMSLPGLQRGYRAAADRAVAHVGLSQAMAWPLVLIGRLGDGVRQGVLAEALGLESPSLVRPIEQLIEAGFIDRRDDPIDRRAKTLHLTRQGVAARDQIETALRELRATLFAEIADADIAACLRVFAQLEPRLGRGSIAALADKTV